MLTETFRFVVGRVAVFRGRGGEVRWEWSPDG